MKFKHGYLVLLILCGFASTLSCRQEVKVPEIPFADITPTWLQIIPKFIATDSNYIYAVSNEGTINIYDISDISSPRLVGGLYEKDRLRRDVTAFEVSKGYAYILTAFDGLFIVDVDPPADAHITSNAPTGGHATKMVLTSDYVLIFKWMRGIMQISVDGAGIAHMTGIIDASWKIRDVDIVDEYVYIADEEAGLIILKSTPPGNMQTVKSVLTTREPRSVSVSGEYAYIIKGMRGIEVIDIDPVEEAHSVGSPYDFKDVSSLQIIGDKAFVTYWEPQNPVTLHIVRLAPPYHINPLGSFEAKRGLSRMHAIDDNYACYLDGGTTIVIVDVNPPESTHIVSEIEMMGSPENMVLDGDYLYMTDRSQLYGRGDRLSIIDIQDPESASFVKTVYASGNMNDIVVSNGYAYLAYNEYWNKETTGLLVVDIDPPADTHIVAGVPTPGEAHSLAISGDHAFIIDYQLRFIGYYTGIKFFGT